MWSQSRAGAERTHSVRQTRARRHAKGRPHARTRHAPGFFSFSSSSSSSGICCCSGAGAGEGSQGGGAGTRVQAAAAAPGAGGSADASSAARASQCRAADVTTAARAARAACHRRHHFLSASPSPSNRSEQARKHAYLGVAGHGLGHRRLQLLKLWEDVGAAAGLRRDPLLRVVDGRPAGGSEQSVVWVAA